MTRDREVVRDEVGVIGTRARAPRWRHRFDPSYRGPAARARCVVCGAPSRGRAVLRRVATFTTGGAR